MKQKIKKIEQEGEVAPCEVHIIRYQVNRNQKLYYYYKLQSASPIFSMATDSHKKTKYKYLGKAGTEAHIDAVEKMTRRDIIDELERIVHSIQESYLNICFGGEIEPEPSSDFQDDK
ncbi:MAG: transposase [Microcoleaceae cyanobacterium]